MKSIETRTASWLHRAILLEEEHRPLPEDPSSAVLVSRVAERLAQVASAIQDQRSPLDVAAYLLGSAAFSVTAIAHIRCRDESLGTTELKDRLLEQLEQSITEADRDFYDGAGPDQLLRQCLSLLAPALECLEDDEQTVEALWRLAGAATLAAERLID